ncbi:MAG: RluA family pseudouridine synthase [Magnetococcales bacterium]|nr:RluA family pseudouridine synthase [Magnetococcales bacterium]
MSYPWQDEHDFPVGRILHRDGLILIINKPPGIMVHNGPGRSPSLENYFDALRFGLPKPPALAHRLDRDTSGCLVLGRHRKALGLLGGLFSEGKIDKTYWAVVQGHPPEQEGVIDLPLWKRKRPRGRMWVEVNENKGRPSQTHYKVLGQSDTLTWLELKPLTGRTHQLRVHCAALKMPILGDFFYGEKRKEGPALHLHAQAISVPLHAKKEPVSVTAPLPEHFEKTVEKYFSTNI